jgi:adenosylcobinamide-GDP ribazoletransferase
MSEIGERAMRLPADTATALAFFSRLPVRTPAGALDLRRSAGAWPLAGLLLAIPAALLLLLLHAAEFPPVVAVLLALALYAALTGAMHEDGLSDVADGFGGGTTRDDKLAIMRDSRLGAFGALALLFAVLLKTSALAALALLPGYAAVALLGAAVLSRSMALWHWNATLPARRGGMAWSAGRPDWLSLLIGLVLGAVATIVLLAAFGLAAVLAIIMAAAGVGLFSSLAVRQIGGHTGDTIGAAQQVSETLLLAGLSACWAGILV